MMNAKDAMSGKTEHARENEQKSFYDTREDYYRIAHHDGVDLTEWKEAVGYVRDGDRILDVGCGVAKYIEPLIRKGRYCGVDLSSYAVKTAREGATAKGGLFSVSESSYLPFGEDTFDSVISFYTLEHFPDPGKSIDEMLRVLKKGGRIIIVSPAWEEPGQFPPSLKHKMKSRLRRARYTAIRYLKYLWLCLDRTGYFFSTIERPSVLDDGEYTADEDVVYIVMIREILNYFRSRGCRIIVVKSPVRAYRWPLFGNAVYNLKTFIKNNPFRKYFGAHLFLVAEKR